MKLTRTWYKCNYCDTEKDIPNFKFGDHSGLNDRAYDMCSEKCKDEHIKYLRSEIPESEVVQHILEWIK